MKKEKKEKVLKRLIPPKYHPYEGYIRIKWSEEKEQIRIIKPPWFDIKLHNVLGDKKITVHTEEFQKELVKTIKNFFKKKGFKPKTSKDSWYKSKTYWIFDDSIEQINEMED